MPLIPWALALGYSTHGAAPAPTRAASAAASGAEGQGAAEKGLPGVTSQDFSGTQGVGCHEDLWPSQCSLFRLEPYNAQLCSAIPSGRQAKLSCSAKPSSFPTAGQTAEFRASTWGHRYGAI